MHASTSLPSSRLRRPAVLWTLVLGCLAAVAASAQPVRSSFPTPVRFDTETQLTSFYLDLDHESPQLPLSQVATAAGAGSAEALAQQVLVTLVGNDLAGFSALADANGDADLAEVFSRYATIFAATPDPTVRDIFYLGGLRYIVLDTSHPEAPIAPLPILMSGSGPVHAFSLMLEPAVQNVSALARNRKLFPGPYDAVASPIYNTEMALPSLFGANPGDHPVHLRFWGHFIGDNSAVGSKAAPTLAAPEMQQALEFFRNYRQALARRDKESLPTYFGSLSRQKLERFFDLAASRDPKGEATWKWLQGPSTRAAEQGAKTTPDPNPRYILVLGSGSYIFFKQGSETLLHYEYVRLGSSGYEVVNFQRQTSLDTLFTWPAVADGLKDEMADP